MKITKVKYANSTLAESMIFKGGRSAVKLPIAFILYLIEDEGKTILVDAGCDTMPGFEMENFIGPVGALERIGIAPEEITDLVITHAHHDHIESAYHFKNATVHIEEGEFESGKKYLTENTSINVFKDSYPLTRVTKIVKIGGHSQGSCIVEAQDGEKTYAIIGDECYLKECLERRIPTGSSCNEKASLDFINKYSDEKYTVLLAHDE
jgi:glyoxylase-like metal-dependent hydrolase (beta-lactamase superfamily II)